jgi:hypothetical protein
VISTDPDTDDPGRGITDRIELRDRQVLVLGSTRA